jgi:rare lipoprotein A (peptidoglycan hydrolase)
MKNPLAIWLTALWFLLAVGMTTRMHNGQDVRAAAFETVKSPVTKVRWYGPEYDGKLTASGTVFNHRDMTFASKTLPFGTRVLVNYGDKSVVVTCTDRGPNHIELTKGAFAQLAEPAIGVINATYYIYE